MKRAPGQTPAPLHKHADRIKARAIRRCGELAKQIEPKRGANQNIREGDRPKVGRTAAANGAGLSPHQLKQALRVANVPKADFERQVESARPPTITKLAELRDEMRAILPAAQLENPALRALRKQNQLRVEASLRLRQRPTRVS